VRLTGSPLQRLESTLNDKNNDDDDDVYNNNNNNNTKNYCLESSLNQKYYVYSEKYLRRSLFQTLTQTSRFNAV
jgi:hypothetical protein